ncbi:hypothetical protein [Streptomyces profundus]|uniref:hypothetical protein n=1 Tax=Streptomyces profundus TaxID=2867410 RepID=UPI001D16B9F2|nr:hypothetical protein [Streptomyces sp. MA3_2.13]UED83736.1 hypothetical protein K4G22_05515 [Streptomyces sp. MA3_2.13]
MTDDVTDEESQEGARRRWPAVTAVAATVVLLAGGVYGVGALRGDDAQDAAGRAGGPLPLDTVEEFAVAEDGALTHAARPSGPLVVAGELPEGPESASVYRFDEPAVTADEVAELAAGLGLDGQAEQVEGGSWTVVGAPEGERAGALLVAEEAPGHWFYTVHDADIIADGGDPLTEPGLMPGETASDPVGEAASDPDSSVSSDEMPAADGTPAPSVEDALAAAEPLLAALGLTDGRVDASATAGPQRLVRAEPVVDGLPVAGMDMEFGVGPDGTLESASGVLGLPAADEERAVTDAQRALDRVNAGTAVGDDAAAARDIGQPCLLPEPADAPEPGELPSEPVEEPAIGMAEPALPDLPCGEPVAAEPASATVEFGLSLQRSEGAPLLVPSWLFRVGGEDGYGHTVAEPAVEHDVRPSSDAAERPGTGADEPADDGETGDEGQSEPASPGDNGAEVAPQEPTELPTGGMRVAGHSPDDRTLTVHFWGGVCDEYEIVAEESEERVALSVSVVDPDPERACIMLAEEHSAEVTLDSPVGERALVDGQGAALAVR